MKTLLLIIILIASFAGCSDEDRFVSPPELTPFIKEFILQGEMRGIDMNTIQSRRLVVRYGETLPKAFGICDCNTLKTVVVLDSSYVKRMFRESPQRIYPLVFHELGHGLLNREHTDTKSFMNPSHVQTDHWEEFVDELFTSKY